MVAQASLRRLFIASISFAAMAPICAIAQTTQPAAAPAAKDAAVNADVTTSADAATDVNAGASDVAQIVVTARRESERAQDIPVAVAALPAKTLEQNRAYTLADVQSLVPSMVAFQSNARNSSIGIRGIGVSSAADGLDTTVGVYVDGSIWGGRAWPWKI